jgi:thiosulfate/3-mercaptopyruvate sulfurtransferase
MKNIVSVKWLSEHLDLEDVVVVDCRFELNDRDEGRRTYLKSHIPKAVYFDLEDDLSGEKQVHGGRHPLPNIATFVDTLGAAGISETAKVIAYDDGSCAMAGRLWFLLKYLGHKEVYVLDGGFEEWVNSGYPATKDMSQSMKKNYVPQIQEHLLVNVSNVKGVIGEQNVQLVDARAPERFKGEVEPIDIAAGHIPSAQNYFWQNNLRNSKWKTKEELTELYESLSEKEIISYCGSGVTACVNLLGMDEAGIDSKLYLGSWSDWCSYRDNKIER